MAAGRRGSTRAIRSSARWVDGRPSTAVSPDRRRGSPEHVELMIRRVWEDVPGRRSRVAAHGERRCGVPAVIARLLCQRGLDDPGCGAAVPHPRPRRSSTIRFCSTGMREAVDRILAAIARRERIAIHGDYDVDGVTSTVDSSPRDRAARRGRRCTSSRIGCATATACSRPRSSVSHAAGARAHRLGRLRHPRDGGGRSRARARRST